MIYLFIALLTQVSFAEKDEKPAWTKIPSDEFSVSAFPEPGSKEEQEDFEILHHYQDTRTKAQCDEGNAQELLHGASLYKNRGPLSDEQFSDNKQMLKLAITLGDRVAGYFKGKYERPRPYMTDETLTPCTPEYTAHRAYPSGHATAAALSACLLAKIYPDQKKEILEYGKSVGDLRVIVGAHHPSDVKAGQKLGDDICKRVLKETNVSELKKVKNLDL